MTLMIVASLMIYSLRNIVVFNKLSMSTIIQLSQFQLSILI